MFLKYSKFLIIYLNIWPSLYYLNLLKVTAMAYYENQTENTHNFSGLPPLYYQIQSILDCTLSDPIKKE